MKTGFWLAAMLLLLLAGCAEMPRTRSVSDAGRALPTAADLLFDAIGDHRLALVGEMHGTRETPALVSDAVERLASDGKGVILALEIATGEQAVVDAYLASAGTPADRAALLASPHWVEPTHDGRDSVAMLDLIERIRALRAGGQDVVLALFDPDAVQDRDRGMADRIRTLVASNLDARIVVLTGNVHAMVAPPDWPMIDGGQQVELPMTAGRHLRDLDPVSINVQAATGEFWACMDDGCKPRAVGGNRTGMLPRLEKQPPGQPWHATLLLPAFTASPPAVNAGAK